LLAEVDGGLTATTGNGPWEVCATGFDFDSGTGPSLSSGTDSINTQILACNQNLAGDPNNPGNPATTSVGWVSSTSMGGGKLAIGELNDGLGPDFGFHGSLANSACGNSAISSFARWMWFNSSNAPDAFSPGANHKEYLIFRLPLSYINNVNAVYLNKDFQNNTGSTVNDLEWVIEGSYPSAYSFYSGPYFGSNHVAQANSTFSSVSVIPSGSNTLIRWSGGASIPNGLFAHVGIHVPGNSIKTLGVTWTTGGVNAGCAHQINIRPENTDLLSNVPVVALANTASNCEFLPLYVGNFRVEWHMNPVALSDLNASGSRFPLRTDVIPGAPVLVPAGGQSLVPIPGRPPMATTAVLVYTVSTSPTLAGPGNTTDYYQLPLNVAGGIPTLSEWGMITLVALLLLAGGLLIRRRSTAAPIA
ncbi:MAG TPA: IPTL-CTERM sorting domain-containing protein, partial [Verrucomicrobiae bacterium]|nr:IPTL-CTERM sorting domain-containing protein [Verrucomicrobiae bacterium]